jgi:hypothetical protein
VLQEKDIKKETVAVERHQIMSIPIYLCCRSYKKKGDE